MLKDTPTSSAKALSWPLFASGENWQSGSEFPPTELLRGMFGRSEQLDGWQRRWRELWTDVHRQGARTRQFDALHGDGQGAQECVLLCHGAKPAARLVVNVASAFSAVDQARDLGLVSAVAPFLFHTIRIAPSLTYSDDVRPILDAWDPDANVFLYLGKTAQSVWRLWALELLQLESEFGIELGYPRCCVMAYGAGGNAERDLPIGRRVIRRPLMTNLFGRYFGYQVLSHTPCSAECAESCCLARRYLEVLTRIAHTSTQCLIQFLKSPVLRFNRRDFLILRNAEFIQDSILTLRTSEILSIGLLSEWIATELRRRSDSVRLEFSEERLRFGKLVISDMVLDTMLIIHEYP
jgi:hypothetical protein